MAPAKDMARNCWALPCHSCPFPPWDYFLVHNSRSGATGQKGTTALAGPWTESKLRTRTSRLGPMLLRQGRLVIPREPVTYSLITPLSARLRTDISITVQECPGLTFVLVPGWGTVPFSVVWVSISPKAQLILS